MHTAMLLSFQDELEKIASLSAGALDMGGLGLLAAPTIQKMRGKPMSEKNKDRAELGGLGVLGASVAAEHAPALKAGLKAGALKARAGVGKVLKLMPKHAAPSMSAMMNMHRLADSAKAAVKAVAKPGAAAASRLPSAAHQAARAETLAKNTAVGGHAWNPAAQAKRAISL